MRFDGTDRPASEISSYSASVSGSSLANAICSAMREGLDEVVMTMPSLSWRLAQSRRTEVSEMERSLAMRWTIGSTGPPANLVSGASGEY